MSSKFREIARAYIPLSWLSFGGPAAHVALFHDKFIGDLHWLTEETFLDLFAISQSLPGPASTQLAFAIALLRTGPLGAVWAFLLWSFPGMLIMIAFAYGINYLPSNALPLWLQYTSNGLTSSALGLIALAGYKLSTKVLGNDSLACCVAALSGSLAISFSTGVPWLYPLLILGGGCVNLGRETLNTYLLERKEKEAIPLERMKVIVIEEGNPTEDPDEVALSSDKLNQQPSEEEEGQAGQRNLLGEGTGGEEKDPNSSSPEDDTLQILYNYKTGLLLLLFWSLFLALAITLRALATSIPVIFDVFGTMYYVGSIIFGGGPVVIPLLETYVVQGSQWMTTREFLLGLSLINALPGPNFNMGVYCGSLALRSTPGFMWAGGIIGLVGIFSPGLILMSGLIPLWKKYRSLPLLKVLFQGFNFAAVGLIFSAFYLLSLRAIVPPTNLSNGDELSANPLFSYPLYTSVSLISYTLAGFSGLPTPLVILGGGLVGFIDWLRTL